MLQEHGTRTRHPTFAAIPALESSQIRSPANPTPQKKIMGQTGSVEQKQAIKDVLGLWDIIPTKEPENNDSEPTSETREAVQIALRQFCKQFPAEVRSVQKIL